MEAIKKNNTTFFQVQENEGCSFLVQLLQKLPGQNEMQVFLKEAEKKYNIKPYKIRTISAAQTRKIYETLCKRFYFRTDDATHKQKWQDNELRFFILVLLMYLWWKGTEITEMREEEWKHFQILLNGKSQTLLLFQSKLLLRDNRNNRKWDHLEEQLLKSIILRNHCSRKWHQIAKQLFEQSSGTYIRTSKQCREKWVNHLDPSIVHQPWTKNQDFELLQLSKVYDKSWSKISRSLSSPRTEHSVKNRYYSLLKQSQFSVEQGSEMEGVNYVLKKLRKVQGSKKNQSINKKDQYQEYDKGEKKKETWEPQNFENDERPEDGQIFIGDFFQDKQISKLQPLPNHLNEESFLCGLSIGRNQKFLQRNDFF